MLATLINLTLVTILANLLMTICLVLYEKSHYSLEKLSPFECGFDNLSSPRLPFSMRFFLLTLIFLIFDVEIALIFRSILSLSNIYMKSWFIINMAFFVILIWGLIHEWNMGALEWSFN